jgi:hypothetical protein
MRDVRPAAVAGSWYPGTKSALTSAVEGYLRQAEVSEMPAVKALIAPHAGLMYSGPVAAFAYKAAASPSSQSRYGAIILVGPSHFVGFHGVSVWPRGAWETPLGRAGIATELAGLIVKECAEVTEHPAAHGREHSLEMQLPFVGHLMPEVPIVPLVMGYQTRAIAYALGDAIARAVASRSGSSGQEADVLLVASSDLSHYEEARTASRMDSVVLRHVEHLDADGLMDTLEREPGHACGGGPIVSVLRAATALGASHARILRYADSGDISGDKSSVVGYAAAAIW